jgi:solute carrier family 35 protein F1/2
LLSILDVEANYLAMLSFQQTKLSSSMLLTSLSVLSTVILRKFIFGSNISGKARLFGVFLCIVGGCLCLQEDVHHNQIGNTNRGLPHDSRIYGDLLALVAAFLYGLNDVLAEYFVKNNDRVEYLAMLGLFGTMFSFCFQAPILEGGTVHDFVTKFGMDLDFVWVLFLLFCFVAMLSFFYVAVSIFLSKNDATILNLSLQSCPLWAVVMATVAEIFTPGEVHWFPPPMFFVALVLVVAGTFSYESEEERKKIVDYSVEDCDDEVICDCEVTKTSPCGSNRYRIDEFIP